MTQQVAVVVLLPVREHLVGRRARGPRRRRRARRRPSAVRGRWCRSPRPRGAGRSGSSRCRGSASPRPSIIACTHQSCHRKPWRRRVPKSAMQRPGRRLQPLDLLPDPGHGAGIEHLQLELAHVAQRRRASAARSGWRAPGSPTSWSRSRGRGRSARTGRPAPPAGSPGRRKPSSQSMKSGENIWRLP